MVSKYSLELIAVKLVSNGAWKVIVGGNKFLL